MYFCGTSDFKGSINFRSQIQIKEPKFKISNICLRTCAPPIFHSSEFFLSPHFIDFSAL